MQSQSRTRSVVLSGLSIALIAVGAAVILPLGPVPFTLQTLMVILVLLVLTPKEGIVTVGAYLVLGTIGLPFFAGFTGGIGILLGPTGGFLMGFLVATLLVGLVRLGQKGRVGQVELGQKGQKGRGKLSHVPNLRLSLLLDIVSIIIVIVVTHTLGMLWFMYITGSTLASALTFCVIPFLIPDIIKAIVAFSCAQPIRVALGRAMWHKSQIEDDE